MLEIILDVCGHPFRVVVNDRVHAKQILYDLSEAARVIADHHRLSIVSTGVVSVRLLGG